MLEDYLEVSDIETNLLREYRDLILMQLGETKDCME